GLWDLDNPHYILVREHRPLKRALAVAGKIWCGSLKDITVLNPVAECCESNFTVGHQSGRRSVQDMVCSGYAVWIALENSTKIFLYHALSAEFLLEMDLSAAVNLKLSACDDIVRQHKTACLRVTCMIVCKDLLWVGTSAGVIVVIPVLKVTSTTGPGSLKPPRAIGKCLP
uniref:RAB3GAP2_N domain-containing protein n=1 Tax=Macrostomum lignano TaxID=282301 RepID=A0A1I8GEK5_9PLAT